MYIWSNKLRRMTVNVTAKYGGDLKLFIQLLTLLYSVMLYFSVCLSEVLLNGLYQLYKDYISIYVAIQMYLLLLL